MANKILGLDAGHGLYTAGKQTPDGIKEWTLNDAVADLVEVFLKPYNVDIVRLDYNEGVKDEALGNRVKMYLNYSVKVDAVVSVHHNAFTGTWNNATGVETYTDKNYTKEDQRLAECIQKRLPKYTGLADRGIKRANWQVINQNKVPAVLTEGGFMDSNIDYKVITSKSGQEAYAKAVAEGVIEFLGLTKTDTTTTTTKKTYYRVRKTWADAKSQLGAFTNLENAKKACKEGYSVFDESGNAVYTVSAKPVLKSNAEIAQEVWAGKWGNGNERKVKLEAAGYNYAAVQAEVTKIKAANTPAKPVLKSNAEIAKEVMAGKWGNGEERKKKLTAAGYNYTAVQAEVAKLVKAATPAKKSATEVAKEIIAGKGGWGNGETRKKNLKAAGYNPTEVQSIVNKLLKK